MGPILTLWYIIDTLQKWEQTGPILFYLKIGRNWTPKKNFSLIESFRKVRKFFGENWRFLGKIGNFWWKLEIFGENWKFLVKIGNFWWKLEIFGENSKFLMQIWNFWVKIRTFLVKSRNVFYERRNWTPKVNFDLIEKI